MTLTASRNQAPTASPTSTPSPSPSATAMPLPRLQSSPSPSPSLSLSLPMPLLLSLMLLLLLLVPPQPCESRYLPTRSHGDELDKLRELMLQILELSNEDPQQQQQPHQMRLHNEANNPLTAQRGSNSGSSANAAWLQKLGAMGALDTDAGYGRY